MLLVDNGSDDESARLIADIDAQDPHASSILLQDNIFHGPAMDLAIRHATTNFIFLLDSDTETRAGGFLELMLSEFLDGKVYAVGKKGWTNYFGYPPISITERHTEYVHPFASIIDRYKYLRIAPFVHHGAPCYRNMWSAKKAGFKLIHFPIEDYVKHFGKITASKHGYHYDRKLRVQLRLNRITQKLHRMVARWRGKTLKAPALPG
jgi:glycosyltransferase involved in cell wall biosynthesis